MRGLSFSSCEEQSRATRRNELAGTRAASRALTACFLLEACWLFCDSFTAFCSTFSVLLIVLVSFSSPDNSRRLAQIKKNWLLEMSDACTAFRQRVLAQQSFVQCREVQVKKASRVFLPTGKGSRGQAGISATLPEASCLSGGRSSLPFPNSSFRISERHRLVIAGSRPTPFGMQILLFTC